LIKRGGLRNRYQEGRVGNTDIKRGGLEILISREEGWRY
jgi:hypothetical protein